MFEYVSSIINLKRCKNNHKVYISNECPFCDETGKRIFRYNTKLKVCKSYCCGKSFKEISWFKVLLDPTFNFHLFRMENRHRGYHNYTDDDIEDYKKYIEDKLSMKESRFEKSNDDENLPF